MKPICLTIAGSDSSAGAGIQADLKTFSSLGCYSATVITALTAQNTQGIDSVLPAGPDFVLAQLDAVMRDMPISAIKIGMLTDASVIKVLADYLSDSNLPIVLDPVMVSSSGTDLLNPTAVSLLIDRLFPLCTLITPNLKEAGVLSHLAIQFKSELEQAGRWFLSSGVNAALITGGDKKGELKHDFFCFRDPEGQIQSTVFEHEEVKTHNSHGTGCTLSSAITAHLAKGFMLPEAVAAGIEFTHCLLKLSTGFHTGSGNGGLDHFPSKKNR